MLKVLIGVCLEELAFIGLLGVNYLFVVIVHWLLNLLAIASLKASLVFASEDSNSGGQVTLCKGRRYEIAVDLVWIGQANSDCCDA